MRALIVDDSRAMRAVIGKMVGDLGVATTFAANGRDALEQLAAHGRPDFALVDWNMPEMNGFEFLLAVRADPRYADLPLLMVTTETEMSQVMKALECGANEYVMKPFTADILRDKLDMLGLVPAA
ncbi:response regulator [Gemmatimonas sp.]|jgi:two-component system chemotaxis response regulator CheY|uniref:response regulator n=1 Tax=Gemmatimonas sp. TaxID=1962908 RepID=UPI0037C17B2E